MPKDSPAANQGVEKPKEPSRWFSVFAASCGFLLIAFAYAASALDSNLESFRWPIIVAGLAAVMAGLGAVATTNYKWATAGGAAGIALLFGYVLKPELPAPTTSELYVRGDLKGTNDLDAVSIVTERPLLVGRSGPKDHFRFVAFQDDLIGDVFYINATHERSPTVKEFYIGCIDIKLLKSRLGHQSNVVDLSLHEDFATGHWRLLNNADHKEYGTWNEETCDSPSTTSAKRSAALRPNAWVDEAIETIMDVLPKAYAGDIVSDTLQALKELDNPDITTRGLARDNLKRVVRNPNQLRSIISNWDIATSSYRIDLGLLVAWVSAIRQDHSVAPIIADALDHEHLHYIVTLTGSNDLTMRSYATETLSWLLQSTGSASPPQSSAALLDEVVQVFTDWHGGDATIFKNGESIKIPYALTVYNVLVAIDDAKCVLRPNDRIRVIDSLQSTKRMLSPDQLGPKTRTLWENVATAGCATPPAQRSNSLGVQ